MDKDQEQVLRECVGQIIGEASMCWNPPPSSEVFDSSRASKLVDRIFNLFEGNTFALKEEIAMLREALGTSLSHSNCYCDKCCKLARQFFRITR